MKKCPFCAEEVQDEAIKCRFCGEVYSDPAAIKKESKTGRILGAALFLAGTGALIWAFVSDGTNPILLIGGGLMLGIGLRLVARGELLAQAPSHAPKE